MARTTGGRPEAAIDRLDARLLRLLRTSPRIGVLEAHTITGPGDLHCRVVAHSNGHLQQVIDRMLEVDGIRHTTSVIALSTPIAYRVLPLVEAAADQPV